MQLPEPAPPPLTKLWDRILRARALPPDLDVQLLYVAIRDRLTHPEWEVRLHALRVLADLLPISRNALTFPFDQVIDNLGHNSPNVRKGALDAVKVFCSHCEEPDCAARAILDKCSYENIRPHSADIDAKANVITGLILSIPSVTSILKRRNSKLDFYPIFRTLGQKLFEPSHRDVALRSLLKLRRVCGSRDYVMHLSQLDVKVQDKFRVLCELYDEDSLDVYYPPRKTIYRDSDHQLNLYSSCTPTPLVLSTDSSSDESFNHLQFYRNNFGKVIIETEIKFDSDTAITMTVLEENETKAESDTNIASEDDSDQNMLKYGYSDFEDADVVVKKVRFGGESIKIRTPDSENHLTSEDDNRSTTIENEDNINEANKTVTPLIVSKMNELKNEVVNKESYSNKIKKSAIPLPVIQHKTRFVHSVPLTINPKTMKQKSKSLNELYDYFRPNRVASVLPKNESRFELTITDVRSPEKVSSPLDPHREIEVLHNLQRSPIISPRQRNRTRFVQLEPEGMVMNITQTNEPSLMSPGNNNLRAHYDWEDVGIVSEYVVDQLHNQENWISAVKAADLLHSALLDAENVNKIEPVALSLVQHMWALSNAVAATKAPAEGAVCALFRGASSECARRLLPSLVSRMGREPLPAALPNALLQRLALHHLVDLIFDHDIIQVSEEQENIEDAQLRATLCLARAAGPAAVLSAVRRRLASTERANVFCLKLRELLNKPMNSMKASQVLRSSLLPVPIRRRAQSTPPPAAALPPRRLRPLPDSAPLQGITLPRGNLLRALSPIPSTDRDSSATTTSINDRKLNLDDEIVLETAVGQTTEINPPVEIIVDESPRSRSPSVRIEDFSEKIYHDTYDIIENTPQNTESNVFDDEEILFESQKSIDIEQKDSPISLSEPNGKSSPSPTPSRNSKSAPASEPYDERATSTERDVRKALSECITPTRHEDWELIVNRLQEIERLTRDTTARAPAACWRAVARSTASHVRSLRSRVARCACSALGALFEHRGRALDPELEEATGALLDRCADVNRFLRADAAAALINVACGGSSARSIVALSRRGTGHRAGPVRAAATQALVRLVHHHTPARMLDLPAEPRTVLLRAAGDLLGDANAETRENARQLCLALGEDLRFRPLIKESMIPSRYRAVEKYIEKLRCR